MTMINILIVNHYCCLNKGDASVLESTIESLSRVFASVKFTILSAYPQIDSTRISGARFLKTIPGPSPKLGRFTTVFFMLQGILWTILKRNKIDMKILVRKEILDVLKAYEEADIVLGRGTDDLTDIYGAPTFFKTIYELLIGVLLGKPVIIFGQSIGPFRTDFKGRVYRQVTKNVLNRTQTIMVRDEISAQFLREIGVDKPTIHITADSSFLLKAIPPDQAKNILSREGVHGK